jgi:metal-sulfur cluster biosynthetic enzyme
VGVGLVKMNNEHLKVAEVKVILKTIIDPEIPVNIWDLGLVYNIIAQDGEVTIEMTLTSPNCPAIDIIPQQVEESVEMLEWVNRCEVELVWDPKWNTSFMSEETQIELGII